MTKLHDVAQLGQSIWYDNIRRAMLSSGELSRLFQAGVSGVTSNPTIFEHAISDSDDYDLALQQAVDASITNVELYESLVLADIGRTADLLYPVYAATAGRDGYVSLEVNPTLAHDVGGTIAEARRLWAALDRPNVMIKVPATSAGIRAFERLIGAGINVNVTLIFSLAQYQAVAAAYLAGLERHARISGDLRQVASVASFFVSRVDTAIDPLLAAAGAPELQGQVAIANATIAYEHFRSITRSTRWARLAWLGAQVQRPLWASTGTKNPRYPDTLYVEQLIGRDTVNTVPPATLAALLDHATIRPTLGADPQPAYDLLARLADLQIDLEACGQQLLASGVAAFNDSFTALIDSIAAKRARLLRDPLVAAPTEAAGRVSAVHV